MIGTLLPPTVAIADSTIDLPGPRLPEEEALVRAAVPKRQREFHTVRACARRALADLGVAAAPILTGPRGEPLWPEGVVGSMTHCTGYRAAVVALAEAHRAIGIDAETHVPLPDGVLDLIARPAERRRIRRSTAATDGAPHWDLLLFSAKESVFKTCYAASAVALGFADAEITFGTDPGSPASGWFHVTLRRPAPPVPTELEGRWGVTGGLRGPSAETGLALTAIALPPGPA